jgi:type II secretory pathway pseudopilin PulG
MMHDPVSNPCIAMPRCVQRRHGFTVIDVLVSMAVIAVLISLMLPQIGKVNESARRVACQSNLRQIGIGTLMYAQEYEGYLPPSVFLKNAASERARPQEMITLRVANSARWDGLGMLYLHSYIDTPEVFYCPSHRGHHRVGSYAGLWTSPEEAATDAARPVVAMVPEIIGNYHYRGEGPMSMGGPVTSSTPTTRSLFQINPKEVSLIADGMRVRSDVNHKQGSNYFRADMTVHWFSDTSQRLVASLPADKSQANPRVVQTAWHLFDGMVSHNALGDGGGEED